MKNILQIAVALLAMVSLSLNVDAKPSIGKYYFIQAKISKRSLSNQDNMNVKAPVVQKAGPYDSQRWRIFPVGNGYYYIISKKSGLYLEVGAPYNDPRAIIWQNRKSESAFQMWKLIKAGDGYYYIQSRGSGLYLDVKHGSQADGATIWQYELNRSDAQKWRFIEAGKVYNINKAITAMLHGREVDDLYLLGHNFTFGDKKTPIKVIPQRYKVIIEGSFVHVNTALFDDTYKFKIVLSKTGKIVEFSTSDRSYNGFSGYFPKRYEKTMGKMPKPENGIYVTDVFLGRMYNEVKGKQRKYSWRDAADEVALMIAIAALYGRY